MDEGGGPLSDWEPAIDVEAAMRDALAAGDQERYFQILGRADLVLPVAASGRTDHAPADWGTWTTGNRTHVLAFTSVRSMTMCVRAPGTTHRVLSFHALAAEWPNFEWWLAINPGLPIEAYLPSWFVSQLTRGDVRLPGRTMGVRARMAQSEIASALHGRARASAAAPTPRLTGDATVHRAAVPPAGPTAVPPVETVEAEIVDASPTSSPARPATGGGLVNERLRSRSSATGSAMGAAVAGFADGRRAAGRGLPAPASTVTPHPTVTPRPPSADPLPKRPAAPTWVPGDEATVVFPAQAKDYLSYPSSATSSAQKRSRDRPTIDTRPDVEDAEIVDDTDQETLKRAWPAGFAPANDTESQLLAAAERNDTDAFLSTLLLAVVIVPVPGGTASHARPRDAHFPWQITEKDGRPAIAVFTSAERFAEYRAARSAVEVTSVSTRFVQLIASWPDPSIEFAVNPGTPVGATLPGAQIVGLANWATEVGLRDDPAADVMVAAKPEPSSASAGVAGAPMVAAGSAMVMQRTIPPTQLPFYLERGYDRVSGFVNRESEVAHLTAPSTLYRALGLVYVGSPFAETDTEVHVLRWVAHRTDLYRLPYGGPHEAAMQAMQGWVIERAPFRGNGFAPGDTDVIAEFKVDSIRLPHGAQIVRLVAGGEESLVATFDADTGRWIPGAAFYRGAYA